MGRGERRESRRKKRHRVISVYGTDMPGFQSPPGAGWGLRKRTEERASACLFPSAFGSYQGPGGGEGGKERGGGRKSVLVPGDLRTVPASESEMMKKRGEEGGGSLLSTISAFLRLRYDARKGAKKKVTRKTLDLVDVHDESSPP